MATSERSGRRVSVPQFLLGVAAISLLVATLSSTLAGELERARPTPDVARPNADSEDTERTASLDDARVTPAAVPTRSPTTLVDEDSFAREMAGLRIAIPRLGIDVPLALGDIARDIPQGNYQGATPERAAFVLPGTALPGRGGNTYVYAHARPGMFLALWQVRVGDDVIVYGNGAERAYRLGLIAARVPSDDVSWLDPGAPERLTLQTSTGPSPDDPRFLAIAYPIGER